MDKDPQSDEQKTDSSPNFGGSNFSGRVIQPMSQDLSVPKSPATTRDEPAAVTPETSEPTTYESFSTEPVNHPAPSRSAQFAPLPSAETKDESSASNVLANIFVTIYGILQLLGSIVILIYAMKIGAFGILFYGLGALGLAFSVFLLLRRDFARQLAIIFQILGLLVQVYSVITYVGHIGSIAYPAVGLLTYLLSFGVSISLLVFLTRPSVKSLFR